VFTGLIEDIGTVARADRRGGAVVLSIATSSIKAEELELGESVAINGVCLTVTERSNGQFVVLAGAETLACTAVGELRVKSRVNLERALRLGDRLGGHMVQGHVDAIATIRSRRDLGDNIEITIKPPRELLRYMIAKGSVAIDGISLTINTTDTTSFSIALIPHTVEKTTLADKSVGATVHLEVDLIGKYVESLLEGYRKS